MARVGIREIRPDDRPWILDFLQREWGSDRQVAHGRVYHPADFPGFVALVDGERTGVIMYEIEGSACEVVLLDAGKRGSGIGTALINTVRDMAREKGCTRLWLVTTNDNLDALRFYQRRGFLLCALRPNALETARLLKPEIPLVGEFGIPLRDEIELEMSLLT